MNLTAFDYIIFGIMAFFTLLGLVRGFIRELSSLSNWIGSGLLTVLLRPFLNGFVAHKISNPIISNIVSSTLIFVIAIIGLSILTSNIAKAINTKFPSSINITLGLAFGFTKGFLISSLIFATILNLFGNTEDLSSKSGPEWLKESQTYKPLSFGAYLILPFADSIFGEIKEKYVPVKNKEKNNKSDDIKYDGNGYNSMDSLIENTEKSQSTGTDEKTKKENGGYKKDQMEKLNHLIDIL